LYPRTSEEKIVHAMRIGAAALVVAAGLAGPASADDFYGFYAGVLGSGASASETGNYFGTSMPPPDVDYDFTLSSIGGGIGVLAGYGMPWHQFVVGLEGDVSLLLGISDTYIYTGTTPNRSDAFSVGALGHIRGIVGLPVQGVTPFIAGGLALAHVTQSHSGPNPSTLTTWTQSGLQFGASIGAGLSYPVSDTMTLRVEALGDLFAPVHYEWTPSPTLRYTDAQITILTVRAGLLVALP
jgi:opacity protein-like surface antigen